jgi:hypothetical protein
MVFFGSNISWRHFLLILMLLASPFLFQRAYILMQIMKMMMKKKESSFSILQCRNNKKKYVNGVSMDRTVWSSAYARLAAMGQPQMPKGAQKTGSGAPKVLSAIGALTVSGGKVPSGNQSKDHKDYKHLPLAPGSLCCHYRPCRPFNFQLPSRGALTQESRNSCEERHLVHGK